ncbi:MAG: 5-formyltetrahydrofolate cyclo-ligase [Actinomycetota bacterium]|nr:5-formyltetrahydrofolate cyclo-ligase [Actinomycetota bacterium]
MLAHRQARSSRERSAAAAALAERVLALPELAGARRVAAYVAAGAEPGTGPLLDRLFARGVEVLLPVLLADDSLDWAPHTASAPFRPGRHHLMEPTARPLGPDAVRRMDAVVVPALACDTAGNRLGRGGGSYDRALAGLDPGVPVVALVYDDEVLDAVPVEVLDRPVGVIVTPARTVRPQPSAPSLDSGGGLAQD